MRAAGFWKLMILLALVSCSKPFPDGTAMQLYLGDEILNGTPPGSGGGGDKYLFVTSIAFDGLLGGVNGADVECATYKPVALPGVGDDYKALLVDGTNRTANPVYQWVLHPLTTYYREDGTLVMTTNASSVVDLAGVGLNAEFAASGDWWTGMDTGWASVGANCGGWNDNVSTSGQTGTAAIDSTAISKGDPWSCGTQFYLICVQQ